MREFKDTQPAHGTLTQENAGDPFTYTPNQGFVGTDSFQVKSFDEFGFGSDRGTVTIDVRQSAPTPKLPREGGDDRRDRRQRRDHRDGRAGHHRSFGGNDIDPQRRRQGPGLQRPRPSDRVVGGGGGDTLDGGASGDRLLRQGR